MSRVLTLSIKMQYCSSWALGAHPPSPPVSLAKVDAHYRQKQVRHHFLVCKTQFLIFPLRSGAPPGPPTFVKGAAILPAPRLKGSLFSMSLPLPPWQQPVCCWLCLPAVSHVCPLLYSHSHCSNSGADYHLLGCSSNLCLTWISLGSQVNLPEVQLSPPAQLTAFQQLSYYLRNRAHTHSQHGLCSALSHYSFRVFRSSH